MSDSRIPEGLINFGLFMQRTDKKQLEIVPPSLVKNYILWQWTDDDSTFWTGIRANSDILLPFLKEKKNASTEHRDKMEALKLQVLEYDHSPASGRHLLDKVSIFGVMEDINCFGIVRGTSLAKKASKKEKVTGIQIPELGVITMKENEHLLSYKNPDKPTSKALPPGIKFILFYRYIGTAIPTSFAQYQAIGSGKRGRCLSSFSNMDLNPNIKLWAWYYACYQSTTGELGEPSPVLKVSVSLSDQINPFPTPTPVPTVTPATPTTPATT